MVESPCTNDCGLRDNMCVSCGRTVDEIVSWATMSDEEKQAVIDRVKHETTQQQKVDE